MGDYSLRIKLEDREFEAHAPDPGTVAKMINQATRKFTGGHALYLEEEIELP